ncbi:unnamed protein product [Rhizophagus irregularis]|nr:unnamed protein product [Rhizophagus irregularis]
MGESSENNIPNDSDSNEIIEIKHDDLEELEQQIIFSSLNEWEVGMVNVSRKLQINLIPTLNGVKKAIAYLTTLKTSFWYHQNKKETKNKHKVLVLDRFWTNVYYLDPFIKLF